MKITPPGACAKARRVFESVAKQYLHFIEMRATVRVSLVILTSRFEATRGLFWDEPRNFEPRSDDKDDTLAGNPSPNFHTTPAGAHLAPTYDSPCSRPSTGRSANGIGFRT
ncbi:hypothetical protein AVEN_178935-1 [Araneus ventricosus]|uniref:Uncharacterized protein n=1 Tax=Araneus ventricosus TaxID=182803 RepID=A0A4Y2IWA0_ARAVE|nr:hypothetical protein AVEN_178935-1 [Araneus ventricosus]